MGGDEISFGLRNIHQGYWGAWDTLTFAHFGRFWHSVMVKYKFSIKEICNIIFDKQMNLLPLKIFQKFIRVGILRLPYWKRL